MSQHEMLGPGEEHTGMIPQPTPSLSRQILTAGQADDGAGASNEQTEPRMPTANMSCFSADVMKQLDQVTIGNPGLMGERGPPPVGPWPAEGWEQRCRVLWHTRLSLPLLTPLSWPTQGLEAWALVLLPVHPSLALASDSSSAT